MKIIFSILFLDKEKKFYEQNGIGEYKKALQFILKELNISEKEYWDNYFPKVCLKTLTNLRMKESILHKIHSYIIKNHSDLGEAEINKGVEESYSKTINE